VPCEKFSQERCLAHPRGALAGPRAHLGAEIGSLTQCIRDYDRKLQTISKKYYPETDLLRQVEGIGPLTALTFVLTVEDPSRFERSRSLEHVANRVVPCEDVEHGHLLEGTQDQGGRCGRAGDP
jgi:transposase